MLIELQLLQRLNTVSWEQDIKKQFPKVFQGLGVIGEEYQIKLKEDAIPYALQVPRNIPIPLRPKVKMELDRMEEMGVISRVENPTDWCAGMVVVPKKMGAMRICVDLKPLNNSVLREPHPIPTVDNLAFLSEATHFSKLDANSGLWQVPLTEESRHLTTFITPFGRYQFNKLPFGISSAPELFQRRMNKILNGLELEGVVCLIDVLVFGRNQEEYDVRLLAAFQRLEEANVMLNQAKCEFNKSSVKFLGHGHVVKNGIAPDPDKTSAIRKMPTPRSISDVRRFMGLVNQLGKFSSRIAEISQPLMQILRSRSSCSPRETIGGQLHMPLEHYLTLREDTLRSKRRLSRLPGPVRSLATTFLGAPFSLNRITSR